MSENPQVNDSAERFILKAVLAAGEAIYHWDLSTDRIVWSRNAAEVLDVADAAAIASGRAYAALMDEDNEASRLNAILESSRRDAGEGVSFRVEYTLRPRGRGSPTLAHVEDCGRWYAGPDGRPAHVFGVVRRVDDRRRLEEQVELFGQYDPMTGLMNRARLGEALDAAIHAAAMEDGRLSFLIASVDNLAVIADAYGYETADDVVRIVGRRLRRVARGEDVVARYSDSKFGLILHQCTEDDLKVAMERFLSVANERVIETASGPVWAQLSIGAVVLPDHAATRDEAIACAEEALAEAAAQPLRKGVIHRPAPNRISQRVLNARCAAEIVEALRYNHFTLAFQPIVDAAGEAPVMHESLLRMRTSDGEVLAAAHLIPIAEKLGLIRLVDYNVLELTIDTLRRQPEARLTMNVSGMTAADARWNGRLIELLEENRDVAERLVMEITETTVLNELEATTAFIAALRDLGCQVAIDDFGAGYSSYKNLKVLNVDIVKLDGTFCENLSENVENQYFVRSLVDLARKLDLKVVAEWVQTEADAAMLRDWGVDYMQGHLFGMARIDHPFPSPRLEDRPGVLTLMEVPEELADLTSPIATPVSVGGERRSPHRPDPAPAQHAGDVSAPKPTVSAEETAPPREAVAEMARVMVDAFASFRAPLPSPAEAASSSPPAGDMHDPSRRKSDARPEPISGMAERAADPAVTGREDVSTVETGMTEDVAVGDGLAPSPADPAIDDDGPIVGADAEISVTGSGDFSEVAARLQAELAALRTLLESSRRDTEATADERATDRSIAATRLAGHS